MILEGVAAHLRLRVAQCCPRIPIWWWCQFDAKTVQKLDSLKRNQCQDLPPDCHPTMVLQYISAVASCQGYTNRSVSLVHAQFHDPAQQDADRFLRQHQGLQGTGRQGRHRALTTHSEIVLLALHVRLLCFTSSRQSLDS